MSKILNKPPYGNCKVLDGDGELMFRCDDRKMNWYLTRGLAKVVSDTPSGMTIQLQFLPKGPGHVGDDFFLQDKPNRCVVCSAIKELTKHHVVPKVYRKFFTEELKSHSSHDVVVLCIDCHEAYEEHAYKLKLVIAEEFGVPVCGTGITIDKNLRRVRSAASALLLHKDKMPATRAEELLHCVREYYGKQDITNGELQSASVISYVSMDGYVQHGKYVVDHLDDLETFVKKWRTHFVTTMQPKYLPEGWDLERSIFRDIRRVS